MKAAAVQPRKVMMTQLGGKFWLEIKKKRAAEKHFSLLPFLWLEVEPEQLIPFVCHLSLKKNKKTPTQTVLDLTESQVINIRNVVVLLV